jgi:hypothetical protein
MALPILAAPKFELVLPSTKKKYKYRPFLAKEEKNLLIALEGGEQNEILTIVKDIINNCVENIDVEKIPMFDLEYIFLKLRSKSIGDKISFYVKHKDDTNIKGETCDHRELIEISISDVEVSFDESHTNKIMLNDKIGVCMKYPTIEMVEKFDNLEDNSAKAFDMIKECIDYIYDAEKVYPLAEETEESVNKFIDSLTHSQLEKIQNFFITMPKLTHTVNWKCSKCDTDDTLGLEGINSFFI